MKKPNEEISIADVTEKIWNAIKDKFEADSELYYNIIRLKFPNEQYFSIKIREEVPFGFYKTGLDSKPVSEYKNSAD